MPAFLTLTDFSLTTPDDRLLCPDMTLAFGRERTGIVGQNGSGKSTLLAQMAFGTHPGIARHGSVGTLQQDWPDRQIPVARALGIEDALARIARVEAGAAQGDDLDRADWTLPARLEETIARLGLPDDTPARRLADLSGGQITRLGLVRLMLDAPELLLLDEPTNNLDAEGRALIADLVARWAGGVVVVSHDRALLEQMDRIVDLTPKGAVLFGGGWSAFAEARAAARARDAANLREAERELARTRRAIRDQQEKKARRDRMGRAVRARGDQPKVLLDARADRAGRTGGRDARLADKLEEKAEGLRAQAAERVLAKRDLRIDLHEAEAHGVVLRVQNLTARNGAFTLGPVDLEIGAGEHVALEGPNGAGKSTLLAAVLKEAGAEAVLLDQHVSLLDPDDTVLGNLRRAHPALTDNDARATLARFAFRNIDAERRVAGLSGGEKLRAGLAVTLGAVPPPRLVILDEPTNHLDIDAVEVLETALAAYPGALLVVSHDATFLEAIGIDRTLRLDAGRMTF